MISARAAGWPTLRLLPVPVVSKYDASSPSTSR